MTGILRHGVLRQNLVNKENIELSRALRKCKRRRFMWIGFGILLGISATVGFIYLADNMWRW